MGQDTTPLPSSRSKRSLTLDLSNLPPLIHPTPPSNTLLFTNLQSLDIFRPDNLQTIRDLISQTAPIHAWSPLKSFRRIIISFFDAQAAIAVRSIWDGEAILGERTRVYFGQSTPINLSQEDNHLALPDAGKLFFISPPPSPPHGWEMKLEDAPNKMVHAEDLADALARLRHQAAGPGVVTPVSPQEGTFATTTTRAQRSRSSTLIFSPDANGSSPHLPTIAVDDMTDEPQDVDMDAGPVADGPQKPILAHTARPPVELMHEA